MAPITPIVLAWQLFFTSNSWQDLIKNISPRVSGCGLIYELGNPLNRDNEDCAIADMSAIHFTEPHYHPETEIYFILQGTGLIVVGTEEYCIAPSDTIVIPPNTAHFIIPIKDLVIGVICTPPFNPKTYVALSSSNNSVNFCYEQFKQLTSQVL